MGPQACKMRAMPGDDEGGVQLEMGGGDLPIANKYRGVSVGIYTITPDVARRMLANNTRNRRPNKATVGRYARAMQAREWWMNGEPIIFSVTGELLNGQHRLLAIVQSGVAVDVLIVRGIDPDAFKTMDNVRPRSAADGLGISGEVNCHALAAAVQAMVTFVGRGGTIEPNGAVGESRATVLTCEHVLSAHPGLRESVRAMKCCRMYRSKHASLVHYLFSIVDPKLAGEFAAVLANGSADIGRPFMIFRESLLKCPARTDLRQHICAKAIKAFNAERSGERPKLLRWSREEGFPVIDGLDYDALAASLL